ncbi:hypothetical protein ENUP19_0266G0038 [Entamoeba nuttalli]|uniref:POPLD (NUC188) domain containing protein n=1 Tax=Entamoeba nuttalli TaxID=412467 RepID=A0ABQ0DSX9_9EUKA
MSYTERRYHKDKLKSNTTLNVGELTASRIEEIKKFTDQLNVYSGNRTVHQAVPRHLRRRQASHFCHVLPHRFIANALREKKKNEKEMKDNKTLAQKMQKKIRRSRRSLRRNFKEYSWGKSQYLMTHTWHAKRCHMKEMWGVKIADERNDKGLRVLLNAAEKRSVVYDQSYYVEYELENNQYNREICMKVLQLNEIINKNEWRMWIANTTKFGPIKLLLNEKRIVIFVHPVSKTDIVEAFDKEKIQLKLMQRLGVFEIIGGNSHRSLLNSFDFVEEDKGVEVLRRICELPPENTPNASIIPLKIKIADINNPISQFYSKHDKQKEPITKLTSHKDLFNVISTELVSQTLEQIINLSDVSSFNNYLEARKAISEQKEIPLLLMANKVNASDGSHFSSGYFLIVPSLFALTCWRRIVWHCVLPLALKERKYLTYEAGLMTYPDDYVDNEYSQQMSEEQKGILIKQANLKPKSKKMNIQTFSVQNQIPWEMNWKGFKVIRRKEFIQNEHQLHIIQDSQNKIIRFELISVNGRPERFAYIHIPEQQLLEQFKTSCCIKIEQLDENVVGRIIKGGYSLKRGSGYGIGFIYLNKYNEIIKEHKDLILSNGNILVYYRNAFSKHIHLGILSLLP